MNEIKISAFLAKLIEDAKEIGYKKNQPFTAERFLVAIIEKVSADDKNEEEELQAIDMLVNRLFSDLNTVKDSLMSYICQERSTSFLDDLYMKKKMQEAFAIATKANMQEVDSIALLLCITADPSEAIRPMLPEFISSKNSNEHPSVEDIVSELDEQMESEEITQDQRDREETVMVEKAEEVAADPAVKSDISNLVAETKRIREELKRYVYGQDNAINVFVNGYFQARMLSMVDGTKKRPQATFLFAGPPGVGKTFLAERVAASLKLPFMRFDMSEYADKEANLEFCGSDKVYKNAKSGNVTSFVAKNPRCVLLFDEIEKAHICVIHLFLQMLDAGRLRDNFTDEEVSFSNAIIIFTTNAGKQLYEESEDGDFSGVSRKIIIKALQKDINPETKVPFFPGAICSRFASGNVVMFNHIGAHNLREIAKKEIEKQVSNLKKETGIKFNIDEKVYTAILFSEGSSADARTVRSRAEAFFNEELYELLRLIASEKVASDISSIENIDISIDLPKTNNDISGLFIPSEKPKVLIFASTETVEICRGRIPSIEVVGVQDTKTAEGIIKSQNIDFALIDMKCGMVSDSFAILNLEDIESSARSFLKVLREQRKDIPVYLIEENGNPLSEEEKISFVSQGVRGVIGIEKEDDLFETRVNAIASSLHQQASMIKLARENKIISFETAQTVSSDGKNAEIKLFDFEMTVAVESEDAKNILSSVSKPNVRFDDVIGAGDAKKELAYFVEYLKNPRKYMGTGVKAPKGVLLYGPPGTGKTMLAKAMASEAGVTFIVAEGNQFLKKYVGEGSEAVHKLFKTARKYAPSILFIDEIDAIAKERKGASNAGGNGEETLTAFLTEMDGFVNDPSKPIFVLAATNFDVEPGRDKSLDPALMRRFDRRVYIELPNKEDRIKFLRMKISRNSALDISENQLDNIAMRSMGMSLAELDSVVELALRSSIREGSTTVNDAILEEAFETFNGGEAKKWDISQLERVARHEAGHALLCWLSGETPTYLTIVARGDHGGYMQHSDSEGKAIYTKEELLARIRTSLGGRAAEIVYYGDRDGISTGAGGDLASATNIAYQIVCSYGMDDDFGLAVVNNAVSVNGAMSVEIRASINRILKDQMEKAIKAISDNKQKIDSLVKVLLNRNYLNASEIAAILSSDK